MNKVQKTIRSFKKIVLIALTLFIAPIYFMLAPLLLSDIDYFNTHQSLGSITSGVVAVILFGLTAWLLLHRYATPVKKQA